MDLSTVLLLATWVFLSTSISKKERNKSLWINRSCILFFVFLLNNVTFCELEFGEGPVRVADRLCDTWGEFDGTEPAGDGLMSRLLIWSSDKTGVPVSERIPGIVPLNILPTQMVIPPLILSMKYFNKIVKKDSLFSFLVNHYNKFNTTVIKNIIFFSFK